MSFPFCTLNLFVAKQHVDATFLSKHISVREKHLSVSEMQQLTTLWIFFLAFHSSESSSDNDTQYNVCPFPKAELIEPCKCLVDEEYRTILTCNIQQDVDADFLSTLVEAFGCVNDLYQLEFNLNGYSWRSDFGPKLVGHFKIAKFKLRNFTIIAGDLKSNVFRNSAQTLEEFVIETAIGNATNNKVESNVFENLNVLKTISLGNSFSYLMTSSFASLPVLSTLSFDPETVKKIEPFTFQQLPRLNVLDLSNQSLESLPENSFANLSVQEIRLSKNKLRKLKDNIFTNLTSLTMLDLSDNEELFFIGDLFSHLENPDLVVSLVNNNISYLYENNFKPLIETKKGTFKFSSVIEN